MPNFKSVATGNHEITGWLKPLPLLPETWSKKPARNRVKTQKKMDGQLIVIVKIHARRALKIIIIEIQWGIYDQSFGNFF